MRLQVDSSLGLHPDSEDRMHHQISGPARLVVNILKESPRSTPEQIARSELATDDLTAAAAYDALVELEGLGLTTEDGSRGWSLTDAGRTA